eukprot:3741-Heterococcus_DN1.PRE.2
MHSFVRSALVACFARGLGARGCSSMCCSALACAVQHCSLWIAALELTLCSPLASSSTTFNHNE